MLLSPDRRGVRFPARAVAGADHRFFRSRLAHDPSAVGRGVLGRVGIDLPQLEAIPFEDRRAAVAMHLDPLRQPRIDAGRRLDGADRPVRELQQRYHVFYILPKTASYGGDRTILGFWRKLLGQNVLELEDPEAVCETIALAIGMMEGTIDLRKGADDLKEFGADTRTLQVAMTALAMAVCSSACCRAAPSARWRRVSAW